MKVLPSLLRGVLGTAAIAFSTMSLVSTSAHADIVLAAANATCTSDANGGNDTVFLSGCGLSGLTNYYKSDRDTGAESGSFSGNYTTAFTLTPGASATISWDGPSSITCPDCYLIAKDGNSTPNWFLFDLSTWDGQETIKIGSLFYSTNPAGHRVEQDFSHVSIWGLDDSTNPPVTIPEPTSLALVGLALAAIGVRRQRGAR